MKSLILPISVAASIAIAAPAIAKNPGEDFISNWDADGDGVVTLAEAQSRRGDIFYMFDGDEDNVLTGTEYDAFDEHRANDEKGHAEEGQQMGRFAKNAHEGMDRVSSDANGDGKVTLEEFTASTAAWFARMDRSGDGVISGDDFGPGVRGGEGMGPGKGQGQGHGKKQY